MYTCKIKCEEFIARCNKDHNLLFVFCHIKLECWPEISLACSSGSMQESYNILNYIRISLVCHSD